MDALPIVFGEALFDSFPGGQRVLGGAPFNVAWHLQGFGARPLFVSRVGDDDAGREILDRMSRWGLSTRGVQIDPERPTGRVRVTFSDGQPSFDIEAEQAYDFIETAPAVSVTAPHRKALLYHGSLAIRSEPSWNALDGVGIPSGGVICDLNLREPWWTPEKLRWCLGRASWIKLNDRELEAITTLPTASAEQCLSAARELARRHDAPNLIVTRGQDRILGLFADGDVLWQEARVPDTAVVDTVGAGDAFSAVLILGILADWERTAILANAADFAADICGQQGAISDDRSLYAGRFDECGRPA